ncbi:hypothetical protein ABWI13_30820 [Streptomyces koyangensis]|uniref:hypothetical protein n=1 Tax=Streptomyces TaxID=1883 RepID=UPI0033860A97
MSISITFHGRVAIGATVLKCPGLTSPPARLTLMASGASLHATCGQKHRGSDGGWRRARCFWPVHGISPQAVAVLAKAKPGKVRLTLEDGRTLEGALVGQQAVTTSSASTRAAAAIGATKKGKGGETKPAPPRPGRTSGSFAAAMNAVAAAAGAVGQTAGALGQTAGAVSKVAGAGATVTREGIRAADQAAKRSHERSVQAAKAQQQAARAAQAERMQAARLASAERTQAAQRASAERMRAASRSSTQQMQAARRAREAREAAARGDA